MMEEESEREGDSSGYMNTDVTKLKSEFEEEKRLIQQDFEYKLDELRNMFEGEKEQFKAKITKLQSNHKTLNRKFTQSKEKFKNERQAFKDQTNQPCEG
jgi:peptidoglycan hydrolase CwlO-like protein